MPWPISSSTPGGAAATPPTPSPPPSTASQASSAPTITLTTLTHPSTLVSTLILTTAVLTARRIYKTYLRRIPSATLVPASHFHHRSLHGKCTSVGDGDNFRLFHTPGGRLAGWTWLPFPSRRIPSATETVKDAATGRSHRALTSQTVHVRLAGVDAPEQAHFGRPAQPFGDAARAWLAAYVLGRRLRVYPYRRDQYERVVATVWVRRWWTWPAGPLVRRDVGLEMIRAGLATVYEAKTGSEFGGREAVYREAERVARARGKGMWAKPGVVAGLLGRATGKEAAAPFESPREYKTRMHSLEQQQQQDKAKK